MEDDQGGQSDLLRLLIPPIKFIGALPQAVAVPRTKASQARFLMRVDLPGSTLTQDEGVKLVC